MKDLLTQDPKRRIRAANGSPKTRTGRPKFNEMRRKEQHLLVEQVGARLRALMPFLNPVKVRSSRPARQSSEALSSSLRSERIPSAPLIARSRRIAMTDTASV